MFRLTFLGTGPPDNSDNFINLMQHLVKVLYWNYIYFGLYHRIIWIHIDNKEPVNAEMFKILDHKISNNISTEIYIFVHIIPTEVYWWNEGRKLKSIFHMCYKMKLKFDKTVIVYIHIVKQIVCYQTFRDCRQIILICSQIICTNNYVDWYLNFTMYLTNVVFLSLCDTSTIKCTK